MILLLLTISMLNLMLQDNESNRSNGEYIQPEFGKDFPLYQSLRQQLDDLGIGDFESTTRKLLIEDSSLGLLPKRQKSFEELMAEVPVEDLDFNMATSRRSSTNRTRR